MRQKLSNVIAQEYAAAGGVKSLADILNHADRTTERNVLDDLAESDAELAEEIRLLLFTFEDVVKLDDRSIQLVLKEVDQKDLALALRGVSEDVRAKIFSQHVPARRRAAREEMEFQPPQRARRRGGAGPDRRRRAPPRGGRRDRASRAAAAARTSCCDERPPSSRFEALERAASPLRRHAAPAGRGAGRRLAARARRRPTRSARRRARGGPREGREEALAALAPALEALTQAAEAVRAEQLARADRLEAHAVDLALLLAEKVIGGAIAVEPELVVDAVRGALRGSSSASA